MQIITWAYIFEIIKKLAKHNIVYIFYSMVIANPLPCPKRQEKWNTSFAA